MDDYTQRKKNMFDDEVFEILAGNKINISDVTWDYLYTLSEEEIKRINDLFIKVSKDGITGKLRLNAETANIRLNAEKWKKSQENKTGDVVIQQTQNIEAEQDYSHLNPVRHNQKDLFILDNFDVVQFRDDIASMEHPIFALKSGNTNIASIKSGNKSIEIRGPQNLGRATIFDKDVWIYCISKMVQSMYEGKEIPRTVEFTTYNFLKTTNRGTGGRDYKLFRLSLERLRGTSITTNISTGGITVDEGFGLIEKWKVIKEDKTGKILHLEVTLPDWLYNSINSKSVLSISDDYFRLRKPIDRRIYEIARKHCGHQKKWEIGLDILHKKTGATMKLDKFRFNIQSLVRTNELPDYCISYERQRDKVIFTHRNDFSQVECEEKRQKAEDQKKRLKASKKIEIKPEFFQKIRESIRYYPQFSNAGLLENKFLTNCIKDYSEEDILLAFENCKKVNFDKIKNPKSYFLQVLKLII